MSRQSEQDRQRQERALEQWRELIAFLRQHPEFLLNDNAAPATSATARTDGTEPALASIYRQLTGRSGAEPFIGGRPVNKWVIDLLAQHGVWAEGNLSDLLWPLIQIFPDFGQVDMVVVLADRADLQTKSEVISRVAREVQLKSDYAYASDRIQLLKKMAETTLDNQQKQLVISGFGQILETDEEGKIALETEHTVKKSIEALVDAASFSRQIEGVYSSVVLAAEILFSLVGDRQYGRKAINGLFDLTNYYFSLKNWEDAQRTARRLREMLIRAIETWDEKYGDEQRIGVGANVHDWGWPE